MIKRGFDDPARRFTPPQEGRPDHIGSGSRSGSKRAVNLSIDAEILKLAKEMKINLSKALEDMLRKATEEERARRWKEENEPVLESFNRLIARAGVFGEELFDLDDDPAV